MDGSEEECCRLLYIIGSDTTGRKKYNLLVNKGNKYILAVWLGQWPDTYRADVCHFSFLFFSRCFFFASSFLFAHACLALLLCMASIKW